jgi:hypothetical protein
MRIEYHPALEAALQEIRNVYNARSPGLGYDFVDEFELQVLRAPAIRITVVKHERRHPAFGFRRR